MEKRMSFFTVVVFIAICFLQQKCHAQPDTIQINTWIKQNIASREQQGDSSGIKYLRLAIAASEQSAYPYGLMLAYTNMGKEHGLQGRYHEARSHYLKAFTIIKKYSLKEYYPDMLVNIGGAYAQEGMFEDAVSYYYKAIQAAEKQLTAQKHIDSTGNTYIISMAKAYSNLALIINQLRELDRVQPHIEKSILLAKASDDSALLAKVLVNDALNRVRKGQIDEAEKICNSVRSINDAYYVYWHKQRATRLLGDIYLSKNNKQAINYYRQAIQFGAQYPYQALHVMPELGKLYRLNKQFDEAENTLKHAEKLAIYSNHKNDIAAIYMGLADLYATQGKYQKAYKYEDAFLNVYDTLVRFERDGKINALEIKYKTAEKDKAIAQNKLLLAQQRNKLIEKNIWIGSAVTVIFVLTVAFILFYKRRKRVYEYNIEKLRKEEEVNNLLAVIKGEEQERSRLGRELHDGIGGLLTTARMFIANLGKKDAAMAMSKDYIKAAQLLDETISEVRKTAHNLLPDMLFNLGLPEAIRSYCNTLAQGNNLVVNFQYYGSIGRMNPSFELFIYRTVQELLQNVVKHSEAGEVTVQLSKHDKTLGITVEDNGKGIVNVAREQGIGLQLIKTRIAELNGRFNIRTGPNKGTSIYIEIDIEDQNDNP